MFASIAGQKPLPQKSDEVVHSPRRNFPMTGNTRNATTIRHNTIVVFRDNSREGDLCRFNFGEPSGMGRPVSFSGRDIWTWDLGLNDICECVVWRLKNSADHVGPVS